MQLRHIVMAVSLITLSTPLLAQTFECTNLDRSHWFSSMKVLKNLADQGYQVVKFVETNPCYKTIIEAENGQKVKAIYDPIGKPPDSSPKLLIQP